MPESNLPKAKIEQFKNSLGENIELQELIIAREQRKDLRNYLQAQEKIKTDAAEFERGQAAKRRTIKIEAATEEERKLRRQKYIAMALKNKYDTGFIPPEMVENIVKVDINKDSGFTTIWLKDGSTITDDGTTITLNAVPSLDNSKELIEMAARNKWSQVELTGSDDFKALATIAAMQHEPPIKTDFDFTKNPEMYAKYIQAKATETLQNFDGEQRIRDLLAAKPESEAAKAFKIDLAVFGLDDATFRLNQREQKRQAVLAEAANRRVSDYVDKYSNTLKDMKANLTNVRASDRRDAADAIEKVEQKLRILRESEEAQRLIRENKIAEMERYLEQKFRDEQDDFKERQTQQLNTRSYKNG